MANPIERLDLSNSQVVEPNTPLRVHHFLLWLTVTALVLTWAQMWIGWWNEPNTDIQLAKPTAIDVVPNVILAGFFTVSLCVGWWWIKDRLRSIEPGEWAAIITSVETLSTILSAVGFVAIARSFDSNVSMNCQLAVSGFVDFALVIVFCLLIARTKESLWWKLFYVQLLLQKIFGWMFLLLWLIDTPTLSNVEWLTTVYAWSANAIECLLAGTMFVAAVRDL